MLHPELLAFQARLEAGGLVVARHADHICVRLPLLCSVRVRYDGERIVYEPRIGAVSRTAATVSTFGIATAAVVGFAATAAALPTVVTVGTLGVLAVGYDVLRYLVIEGAMNRATLLWELRPGARTATETMPSSHGRDALPSPNVELRSSSGGRERAPASRDGDSLN